MNDDQIFNELKIIVTSINNNVVIKLNTALLGESVLDSLEFINYITKVEESFNIHITDSDITDQKLGIIGNMIQYIISNKNQ